MNVHMMNLTYGIAYLCTSNKYFRSVMSTHTYIRINRWLSKSGGYNASNVINASNYYYMLELDQE